MKDEWGCQSNTQILNNLLNAHTQYTLKPPSLGGLERC